MGRESILQISFPAGLRNAFLYNSGILKSKNKLICVNNNEKIQKQKQFSEALVKILGKFIECVPVKDDIRNRFGQVKC